MDVTKKKGLRAPKTKQNAKVNKDTKRQEEEDTLASIFVLRTINQTHITNT